MGEGSLAAVVAFELQSRSSGKRGELVAGESRDRGMGHGSGRRENEWRWRRSSERRFRGARCSRGWRGDEAAKSQIATGTRKNECRRSWVRRAKGESGRERVVSVVVVVDFPARFALASTWPFSVVVGVFLDGGGVFVWLAVESLRLVGVLLLFRPPRLCMG